MESNLPDENPILSDYISAVKQNISGPVPVFLQSYDAALRVALSKRQIAKGFRSYRMFVLASASLRASLITTLSGATPQAVPLLRHALECALYGYCFEKDYQTFTAWRDREKGKRQRDTAREKLATGRLFRLLETRDTELAKIVKSLYENLISMGSHPNVMQVEPITKFYFEEGKEEGYAKVGVLFGESERATAFVWIGFTYEAVSRLFQRIWPDDFLLLGVEASLRDAMFQLGNFRAMRAKSKRLEDGEK